MRLRSRIAAAHRYGAPAAEIATLHAQYRRMAREDTIREAVTADPPLTADEAKSLVGVILAAVSV